MSVELVLVVGFLLPFSLTFVQGLPVNGHRGVQVFGLLGHLGLPVLRLLAVIHGHGGEVVQPEGISVQVGAFLGGKAHLGMVPHTQDADTFDCDFLPLFKGGETLCHKLGQGPLGLLLRTALIGSQGLDEEAILAALLRVEADCGGRPLKLVGDDIHLGAVVVPDKHAEAGNDDGLTFEKQF